MGQVSYLPASPWWHLSVVPEQGHLAPGTSEARGAARPVLAELWARLWGFLCSRQALHFQSAQRYRE